MSTVSEHHQHEHINVNVVINVGGLMASAEPQAITEGLGAEPSARSKGKAPDQG